MSTTKLADALRRIADPRNTHFAGDAQVVARAALASYEAAQAEAKPAPAEPNCRVMWVDTVGAYRHTIEACKGPVAYVEVDGRVYYPLTDAAHQSLVAAACGHGKFPPLAAPAEPAGKPVACIQHFNGDKGRLFFIDEVDPPPGSDSYIDAVTWTMLCAPTVAPAPQLPPMPEPHWPRYYQGSVPPGAYTADQMKAYARAAIEAASKGEQG